MTSNSSRVHEYFECLGLARDERMRKLDCFVAPKWNAGNYLGATGPRSSLRETGDALCLRSLKPLITSMFLNALLPKTIHMSSRLRKLSASLVEVPGKTLAGVSTFLCGRSPFHALSRVKRPTLVHETGYFPRDVTF
jgi:hypothetical protein